MPCSRLFLNRAGTSGDTILDVLLDTPGLGGNACSWQQSPGAVPLVSCLFPGVLVVFWCSLMVRWWSPGPLVVVAVVLTSAGMKSPNNAGVDTGSVAIHYPIRFIFADVLAFFRLQDL